MDDKIFIAVRSSALGIIISSQVKLIMSTTVLLFTGIYKLSKTKCSSGGHVQIRLGIFGHFLNRKNMLFFTFFALGCLKTHETWLTLYIGDLSTQNLENRLPFEL